MRKQKLNRNLILVTCLSLLVVGGFAFWMILDGKGDSRPVVETRADRADARGINLR